MTEYFKPFFDNKCTACEINDCFNTDLFSKRVKDAYKKRGVQRVRYDQDELMHEHALTITQCPTKKIIEEKQSHIGKGFIWKLLRRSTIKNALKSIDPSQVGDPEDSRSGKLPYEVVILKEN